VTDFNISEAVSSLKSIISLTWLRRSDV